MAVLSRGLAGQLADASKVPVYAWGGLQTEHGIPGGAWLDFWQIRQEAVTLVFRGLTGEMLLSVSPSEPETNRLVDDGPDSPGWELNESRFPAGTMVRHRDPGSRGKHPRLVLAGIVG